jgi:hypothetical protein
LNPTREIKNPKPNPKEEEEEEEEEERSHACPNIDSRVVTRSERGCCINMRPT